MISVEAEATSSTTTTTTTATTTTDLEPPTCCPGSIIPLRAVLTMILNPEVRRRWINIYSSIRPSSESKTWTPAPTEWMRPHRTGPLRWRQTEVPPRRKGFSGVKRINFAYVLDDEEEQEEVEDKYGEEKDEQLVGTGSAGPKDMDVAAASAPREHSTSPTGSRVSFTAGESTISSSVLRSREIRLKAESQLGELLAKPKRLHGREGAATDTERESSTSPPGGKAAVDVAAAAAAAAVAAISTGRPGDPQPSQTDEKTWYAEMSKRFDLAGRKPVNPPGRVNGTLPKTNSLNKPGANGPGASEQRLPSILKKYTSTTDARFNPNHWSGSVVQDSSNGEKGLGAGKVPVVRRRASTVAIRVGNAD
ncbi:hypothetical protein B0T22DRAFT_38207 [Podospora appendiculata]|uniref:Uncharacterized protein n=1 Tax=Podospora appendiculata TaxID=314037 RepID=A0AAE0XHY8_9PEZI|nr:hypothetical protein B0T22DRAFT_38207 [Podospora appendiculata]